ncbi:MAG: DUF2828 domain-containing protein [Bacteroidia bacterium]|nr:DUF2828 domain-containing protein [Bacteroidia bacterium]
MFINDLRNELNKEKSITENGAIGYATSGKKLLDFNFRLSSYRNMSEKEIFRDFMEAYTEDKIMAMRMLFYSRDIRGGQGERRLFRIIIKELAKIEPKTVEKIAHLISEFGRWDDLFCLFGTPVEDVVYGIIIAQLANDVVAEYRGKPISLLAKWMPSANASSSETKALARKFISRMGVTEKQYRKMLSSFRAHLNIVECKMSANEWSEIKYDQVPSKANLIYNTAFYNHDEERRKEFLTNVEKGKEKIHSGTNFPHDIVSKYGLSEYLNYKRIRDKTQLDRTLEAMWKALPNYGDGMNNTLVVADGSGSMYSKIGNTSISALAVANSLAIYFAERCTGEFKNNYITFSEKPQLVNLGEGTLLSKLVIASQHNEVANTNIQAVFDLILKTAISKKLYQEDLPSTILIISDMEFDSAVGYRNNFNKTLFEGLASVYAQFGYKIPKLVFWNVMSRTLTIPAQENESGVILLSGFSPSAINMALSNEVDPYKALVKFLNDKRYDVVEEALQ